MAQVTKDLYETLLKKISGLRNVIIEEKKTSIHLVNRAAFAGIHPRKSYLILNIVSQAAIKSPRIYKSEQLSKNKFHNEVKIEKEGDINAQLLGWLKSAYDLMSPKIA
jgi:hypothetical protein